MTELTIREPNKRDAEQLAAMLCEDSILRSDLGILSADRPTGTDFMRKLNEWSQPRRATTFAILVHNTAIGTISLSHRSQDGLVASIGYWVGSNYRRHGYCKRAFAAVCARAESEGIISVSATIAFDNTASRRIWEQQGAIATEVSPGRFKYELKIGRQALEPTA